MPASACSILLLPSKANGLVTIPIVKTPFSRAIWATTGAAPVPVPPPIPAVINTISVPFNASAISSRFSSAAFWPISGLEPAPLPWVIFSPIWIFCAAFDLCKAWWSVLIDTKSTHLTPADTILSSALPPPPPTPITLIFTILSKSLPSSNAI